MDRTGLSLAFVAQWLLNFSSLSTRIGAIGLMAAALCMPGPVSAAPAAQAELTFEKFPMEFADYYCTQGLPARVAEHRPDFCRSENPLLADATKAAFATTLMLDESEGTGKGYDRLYVDFDRDGQYTDDPVYTSEPCRVARGPDRLPVIAYFSNVVMPRKSNAGDRTRVQVFLEQKGNYINLVLIPQNWAVGQITIDGRTMPAALIDANWNDEVTALGGFRPGQASHDAPRGDLLILGIEGETALRPATSLFVPGDGGSAKGFLTRHLVLDSGTYEIKAAQSGGKATLSLIPADVPTGTVKLTERSPASHVLLVGQSTCVMVPGNRTEIQVPADTYLMMSYGYSRTVFDVKQGQQTEVDPIDPHQRALRRAEQAAAARAAAQPPPAQEAPAAPAWADPADPWTLYVQQFIARHQLDPAQHQQAWSILKDLKARAAEYRTAHKADYEAVDRFEDKVRQTRERKALDGPIEAMFDELKARLSAIPGEPQSQAAPGNPQKATASRPQ